MAEKKFWVAALLYCDNCHPNQITIDATGEHSDRDTCPLYLFEQAFMASDRSAETLKAMVEQYKLIFHIDRNNGVPNLQCPEKKGRWAGEMPFFLDEK